MRARPRQAILRHCSVHRGQLALAGVPNCPRGWEAHDLEIASRARKRGDKQTARFLIWVVAAGRQKRQGFGGRLPA